MEVEEIETLDIDQVGRVIVDASLCIHKALGPGLLESAYESILEYELKKRGLSVQRQFSVDLKYDGITFADSFRVDLLVNNLVVIELKSVEKVSQVHFKQVHTYLKLMKLELGFLINFGAPTIKYGLTRIVNDYKGNFVSKKITDDI